jgi:hypothetical protein
MMLNASQTKAPRPRRDGCRAMTDAARIRELMLINLFAVFNERDAKRRSPTTTPKT